MLRLQDALEQFNYEEYPDGSANVTITAKYYNLPRNWWENPRCINPPKVDSVFHPWYNLSDYLKQKFRRIKLDKMKVKEALMNSTICTPFDVTSPTTPFGNVYGTAYHSFDTYQQMLGIPAAAKTQPCIKEEKEDTMYLNASTPLEIQQKAFLNDRLRSSYNEKLQDLRLTFGLVDDDAPTTWNELVERITSKRFTITEEKAKERFYFSEVMYAPTWRDPSKVKDQDGFDKAEAEARDAKRDAEAAIMIKSADEGLAAVEAFEAKSFS